jgi:glucose/arabinose dehydrogenase
VPTGYKVVRINLDSRTRKAIGAPMDFATGFLPAGSAGANDAIGRPVDVMAEPGGTLYISDDRAGAIYKVSATQ